jgi:uncharacterized protein YndB with AHSA1/START domain
MHGDALGGPIRWRMHVAAAPEAVFAALDSDDGRASFWAESAVETDGYVAFRFSNGLVHRSRILDRWAPRWLVLDYFGSPARFDLTPDGSGGTELLLTHEGVPPDAWIDVHAGWLNVLFPLKAWLVHGVDLRNHDPRRSWDHGYADA